MVQWLAVCDDALLLLLTGSASALCVSLCPWFFVSVTDGRCIHPPTRSSCRYPELRPVMAMIRGRQWGTSSVLSKINLCAFKP